MISQMDSRHLFIIGDEHTKYLVDSINVYFNHKLPFFNKKSYIFQSKNEDDAYELLEQYRAIADLIDSIEPLTLRNSIAIVTLPFNRLMELKISPNFLTIGSQINYKLGSFSALVGMLLLTFPEVRWIFYDFKEDKKGSSNYKFIDLLKEIQTLSNHNPIFDCFDYRKKVRDSFQDDEESKGIISYLLKRESYAASIDDEEPYAYLHGYIAYRLGYKGFLITTKKAMDEVLKEGSEKLDICFTFEDLFLGFPDNVGNAHLSDLKKRDDEKEGYIKLKNVKKRIFVTVGHKNIKWHDDNKSYIGELKGSGKEIKVIYKPSSGIYNILQQAGLAKTYWKRREEDWERAKPTRDSDNAGGHSAPGRLLAIAERLIDRAEKIFDRAKSVQDCIHGATLALEAQELLGYRTPTTCLRAIALRHKLEVKAECMFYGVEYNVLVEERFKELEREINAVSCWFASENKESSVLNAQMSIVTEIIRIFESYGQFEEQQKCLNYFRKLNHRWYFKNHPWMLPLQPIRWYVEKLVGSFKLFVAMLFFWPILGGIISWQLKADFGDDFAKIDKYPDFMKHCVNSLSIFFGIQPVQFPENYYAVAITIALMLAGFMHLGIFISHLYTLISRGK